MQTQIKFHHSAQNIYHHVSNLSRLNLRNSCYHSILDILFSGVLSKNVKIKIYK
jgi:hypothetical protein